MLEAVLVPELLVGAGVAAAVSGVLRFSGPSSAKRIGGIVVVASSSVGLVAAQRLPILVLASVLGLMAAGFMWTRNRVLAVLAILVASSPIVALSPMSGRLLFNLASIVYVLAVGWAVMDFEIRHRCWLTPVLLMLTILGVYLTVPNPDSAAALVGASIAFLLLPGTGSVPVFALVGLILWVSVVGGADRTGSIVGALASVGVLLVEPVGYSLKGSLPRHLRLVDSARLSPRFLLAIHLFVVTVTSRVAGFRLKSEPALVLAILALAVGWALMAFDRGRESGDPG